jgi:hypothetical protein
VAFENSVDGGAADVTPRAVSEPPISRASGTERAWRPSFGTTSVSPARTAASAWARAVAVGSGQAVVGVDPVIRHVQLKRDLALRGEVLLVQTASRVAGAFGHARSVR